MDMISSTVLWAVLGLVLVVAEMLTNTFFLLFFGVSALVVALFRLMGLDNINIELALFSGVGVAGILVLRKRLHALFFPKTENSTLDAGQKLLLSEDVPAGSEAVVRYQGTAWSAANETDVDMSKGMTVLIDRVDGSKIILKTLDQ